MAGNLGRKGDRREKLRKMNSKRDNSRRENSRIEKEGEASYFCVLVMKFAWRLGNY